MLNDYIYLKMSLIKIFKSGAFFSTVLYVNICITKYFENHNSRKKLCFREYMLSSIRIMQDRMFCQHATKIEGVRVLCSQSLTLFFDIVPTDYYLFHLMEDIH